MSVPKGLKQTGAGLTMLAAGFMNSANNADAQELKLVSTKSNKPKVEVKERKPDTGLAGESIESILGEGSSQPPRRLAGDSIDNILGGNSSSGRTNQEQVGRTRVDNARNPEFVQAQLKERNQLLKDYAHLLPTNKAERKSFDERISPISNNALGTLLRGADFLLKKGLLTNEQKVEFFRAASLNNSAKALGRATNVKRDKLDSDDGIRAFLARSLTQIPILKIALNKKSIEDVTKVASK